ncbi:MAG: histidine kinase, partial [Sphingopyxis sp.]|nr:histidine kinase [Sphingopyxis sp.]
MVHELRSPLNAISGFAQLIEGQFFGPVSNRYRDLARNIIADANFLSGAFEDIDLAARLDAGRRSRADGLSDAAAMVY